MVTCYSDNPTVCPRHIVTFICVEKTAIPRDSREHLHTAVYLSAPRTMRPRSALPSQAHESSFWGLDLLFGQQSGMF